MKFSAFLAAAFAATVSASRTPAAQFSGHQVLRFNVESDRQIKQLKSVLADPRLELDNWSHAVGLGEVDVRVPPFARPHLASVLKQIEHRVLIPDVQRVLDQQNKDTLRANVRKQDADPLSFESVFANYQDTETYVKFLAKQPGSKRVEIGQSYQNDTIYGIQFGRGDQNIVVHGGIHAREWITPITVTYTAYTLMTDKTYAHLLDKFTFTIIPVLNIDGYRFTRSGNRLWRKNMQPNDNSRCFGTDLNRNFGYKWDTERGASTNPCAEDFRGSGRFTMFPVD
jgi:carboxypeptidase A4